MVEPMPTAGPARRLSGIGEEARQFAYLSGHFFRRLFRNDVVDFEDQMKERLIATLSILAIIVFWSSEMLLFKYHFVPDVNISWQEKTYILTLVMIIFGIITLLEWDVLFPDRQDFLNLMPLPVRLRTFFLGKMASFILFIGLFSVAMNIGSSVLFALYLAQWRAGAKLVFAAWYAVSHLLAGFAACSFIFFACIFLQFLLMAVLPYRFYRRASLFVRGSLLGCLTFLLLAFLVEPAILDKSFRSMAGLKSAGGALFFRFPPLWFVGLYEKLLGTRDPMFGTLAKKAVFAVLLSLLGFAAASGLSYDRHVRKTLESARAKTRLRGLREAWESLFGKLALRRPEERAVYRFFAHTLRSSQKHRITVVYYLAIAGAVIMLYAIPNRESLRLLTPSNVTLLTQPLVVCLIILAGLRSIVNVPASPKANWIFEVTETGRTIRYIQGLKKAIFCRWLLPFSALVLVSHVLIWDAVPALEHAVFILLVSGLAMEAFFYRFRKVPFACSFVPGKFRFHVWGIPLALFFLVFVSVTARIEKALLQSPTNAFFFLLVTGGLWLAFHIGNLRFYQEASLLFEDQPEPAMVTFPEGP
jgi:hypothetical protein